MTDATDGPAAGTRSRKTSDKSKLNVNANIGAKKSNVCINNKTNSKQTLLSSFFPNSNVGYSSDSELVVQNNI